MQGGQHVRASVIAQLVKNLPAVRETWVQSLVWVPPLEVRPSSVAPDPEESRGAPPPPQDPSPLRGTLGGSLRSPAEGEGRESHGQRRLVGYMGLQRVGHD